MFNNQKPANAPCRARAPIGAVAVILATCFSQAARAQEGDMVRCSSDGGRVFCDADTRGGPRLARQLSDARCEEGSTWGYTDRGIWVDRGCQAEFILSPEERRDVDRDRGRFTRIEPGTLITVRTNEFIDADRADGRVFTGVVDHGVRGSNGTLAIPRGSNVELLVRVARDNDLILDLESVAVNGQRYALQTAANRIESQDGIGRNRQTGEYLGGGALLGTIIGAIAGGGKGAAIGAAAGAAAGAGTQVITRGRTVRVPPESVLTFRIEQPLVLGVVDRGFNRDGRHYHRHQDGDQDRYDPNR